MSNNLPIEIVSLVHHVKLNEKGWLEKAIQAIIVSFLGLKNNMPYSKKDLYDELEKLINYTLPFNKYEEQLRVLQSQRDIIFNKDKLFILSDNKYENYLKLLSEHAEIETKTRDKFRELCKHYEILSDTDKLWNELNDDLIIPLIKNIGAKTYELISGEINISDGNSQFANFLCKYDAEKNLKQVLLDFFDFSDSKVRSYILDQLNAYFFVEATNLNQETIDRIYEISKIQPNLKIYIDTNILLTLLNLHDNPSNEAAESLLDLINEIKNKIIIHFYVLPITISEFQNLLLKTRDYLVSLRPTVNQADAILKSDDFSGIIKKYFQIIFETKKVVDVESYFDPFINNLSLMLKKHDIRIENCSIDNYSDNQTIIDDLMTQVEYRYNKRGDRKNPTCDSLEDEEIKNRIYDSFKHDCIMWHYVKEKRPTYIDSTKDIKHWILTIDFKFLEFDRFKQLNDTNIKIGMCLHPNELISLLQFWIPRSEKFEKAILGNFRLTLLFKEIDYESQSISSSIIGAMAIYENNAELSSEHVTELLTNMALREKIKSSNTVEMNAKLVKEEVIKLLEEKGIRLKEEKEKSKGLIEKVSDISSIVNKLNATVYDMQFTVLSLRRNIKIQEIKSKLDLLHAKRNSIVERLNDYKLLIEKADQEVIKNLNSPSRRLIRVFRNESTYKCDLENKIHSKYYDRIKYNDMKNEEELLIREINNLNIPLPNDTIIVFCENQNAKWFNNLGIKNLYFHPENNSASVFIKTRANPAAFGIRDRDYLTDSEINKIQKKYDNYIILKYYCFENYLYHPANIKELNLSGFNIEEYILNLVQQKKSKFNEIISNFKQARKSYEEFRIAEENIKDKDENEIIYNLESDEIETFMKSFSLKTDYNKKFLELYQLSEKLLTSTQWFKNNINELFSNRKI